MHKILLEHRHTRACSLSRMKIFSWIIAGEKEFRRKKRGGNEGTWRELCWLLCTIIYTVMFSTPLVHAIAPFTHDWIGKSPPLLHSGAILRNISVMEGKISKFGLTIEQIYSHSTNTHNVFKSPCSGLLKFYALIEKQRLLLRLLFATHFDDLTPCAVRLASILC